MNAEDFKAWRNRLGLTQQEAADKLSRSLRAVGYWEAGKRGIPATVIKSMKEIENSIPLARQETDIPSAPTSSEEHGAQGVS